MLNLRKAKKYEFIKRLLPFFTALLLITVVYSISFLFQTVRAASTPTFRYYSNGTQIGATGGQFGSGVYKLNQLPNIKTRYQGDVNLTIGGDQCVIVVTITLTSLNSSTGSIKAFSPYYVSSPGSDTTLTCGDEVAAHPDFNNPSISISGSGNEQPVPNPTEPISTKFINLVAYFPKTKSELPNNIKAILKNKVSSKIVATNSLSPSDDKETSTSTASKSFGGVEPDTYTICIEPTGIFSISCQDVTKLSGVIGVVTFGANPHADEVGVTIVHSHDQYHATSLTYGPHTLLLLDVNDGDNKISETESDSDETLAGEIMASVELYATFNDIPEGKYKVCIKNTEYCSAEFTKDVGLSSHVRIELTEEESATLATETLEDGSSCNIPGLGWILCPVINLLGSIADSAYSFISTDLLEVKTEVLNSDSGNASTIGAWSIMRNIANVAFVIAFLIIIFSQLTGAGITNYGVKKMLPRIVIAAILVNLSYYICQIAVDISNIVGRSLGVMFDSVEIGGPVATASSGGSIWMNLVGGVIGVAAGAAIVYANLAALIPLLISAFVALVMILFILSARQAIIILLIVISPLAFVAYLLPNTEGLYKKWQKTFLAMLMLYPIIGLVFGVSKFASTILTGVAGNNKVLSIVAAAIGVLPLFVVPGLLKKSLDGVGNIGATLNNLGGKMGGWAGKKVMDDTIAGQAIKYKDQKAVLRRAQMQSGTYDGKNKLRRGWGALHGAVNRAGWTGEFGNRRSAQGFALADAEDAESLKNAGSLLNNLKVDGRAISNAEKIQLSLGHDIKDKSDKVIVSASDITMRRAGMQQAAPVASVDEAHALLDASRSMSAAERKTLVSSMIGSSAVKKAPWLGGKTFADIEAGTASSSKAMSGAINNGGVTAEALVGADDQALKRLNDYILSTAADSPERKIIRDAVADIDKNPLYKGRVAEGSAQAQAIQALKSV